MWFRDQQTKQEEWAAWWTWVETPWLTQAAIEPSAPTGHTRNPSFTAFKAGVDSAERAGG